MSKFKVRLKLQGLEVDIEGTRDDVATIGDGLRQQLGGLFGPMASIVDGELAEDVATINHVQPQIAVQRKFRRKKASSAAGATPENSSTLNFKHDPARYGIPRQQWNPTQKSLWLLYVVREALGLDELSAGAIANTFNQHFKQAGKIRGSNVSRDLGKAKQATPPQVGENTTANPASWFLTEEGVRRAQALVAEALGPNS